MMRADFDPTESSGRSFYRLLNSVVVPRPIAWVSSTSAEGVDNLAPHSFFTVACVSPPIVQFTSVGRKDSLSNVEATREFVVNLTPESMFEQVNATGTDFPAGEDEFAAVGIGREPSLRVAPPRVADSPVAIECELHGTICLGDSTVVLGRVVHLAVEEGVLVEGHPQIDRLNPLARLGRNEWGVLGEIRRIDRISHDDWPGHYERADGGGDAGEGA